MGIGDLTGRAIEIKISRETVSLNEGKRNEHSMEMRFGKQAEYKLCIPCVSTKRTGVVLDAG